jgi:hypothetical protein
LAASGARGGIQVHLRISQKCCPGFAVTSWPGVETSFSIFHGDATFPLEEITMPRGDKSSYTGKQKRKAAHIEASYRKRGTSKKTAEKRAWATVNKQSGRGKKKK